MFNFGWGCCEDCIHHCHTSGQCRGIMDCDPDEDWCECENDYFDGERKYDEETEEMLDCEDYEPY